MMGGGDPRFLGARAHWLDGHVIWGMPAPGDDAVCRWIRVRSHLHRIRAAPMRALVPLGGGHVAYHEGHLREGFLQLARAV